MAKQKLKTYLAWGIGAAALVGAAWYIAAPRERAQRAQILIISPQPSASSRMEPQLQIQDLTVGTGTQAKTGDIITVNYVGTFTDGKKFDSSYDKNQPFSFKLGAGQVIKGWDQGLIGMKVGGKRTLTIPGALAYGEKGFPGFIPPNATLVFEVELLNVQQ